MNIFVNLLALVPLLFAGIFAPLAAPNTPGAPSNDNCLYPSIHERFGITVGSASNGSLNGYDISNLWAGNYLNWGAVIDPAHPNGMNYYPMIHVKPGDPNMAPYGYEPNGPWLQRLVRANPGATWLIGNEADYRWHHDAALPEEYARIFHDIATTIKGIDPSARLASNSLATVSTLRLAWLNEVWDTYQTLYGEEMPVDVWAIHSYVVNEMVHEWGPGLPPGIENVVGYSSSGWESGTDSANWTNVTQPGSANWTAIPLSIASGGSVHESDVPGARAYFAFAGDWVTLYLTTGPDSGFVDIYRDKILVDSVDLYSAEPGQISVTYTGLPVSDDPNLADRHHLRIQTTLQKNQDSSGYRAAVDAIEAPSTAGLPGGRLEDDSEMQARILSNVEDHDNLAAIVPQIRLMRQWMADHGQRHKPLINTEYGVLIGEEFGFTYERVRDFMTGSFDLYVNDQGLVDDQIGMPEDGERLLQQWFWFILALDDFNGSDVHTGLYDAGTREMLPLGQDFASYVQDLVLNYVDMETTYLQLTPDWPLFAGETSQVMVRSSIRNWGNEATPPFWARLSEDSETVEQWYVDAGLSENHGGNDSFDIEYAWETVIEEDRTLTLTADSASQVDEPCDPNNVQTATLAFQPTTDLSLSNLSVTPEFPSATTDNIEIEVDLANLGSLGTADDQITINFWDGDPANHGVLLHSESLLPGENLRTASISFDWEDFSAGEHQITVELVGASEETNLENNTLQASFYVPQGNSYLYLPALLTGGSQSRSTLAEPALFPMNSPAFEYMRR